MTRLEIVWSLYREAAEMFAVEPAELGTRSRSQSVARARMVAIGIARARYGWSFPELGKAFGRDHSTCMHAVKWARDNGYVLDLEAAAE